MSEDRRGGGDLLVHREVAVKAELAPEVQLAIGALRTALQEKYLDAVEVQTLLRQVPEKEATELLTAQTERLLNDVINPLAQHHLSDFHSKRQYEEYQGEIAERKRIAIMAYEKLCQAAPGMTPGQFATVTEFGQKLMERFEGWRQKKYETKDKTMPDPLEFIRAMEKLGPVHEAGLKAVREKAERERKESPQYLADRLKYALGDYPQKAGTIRDFIEKLHNKGAVDKVVAAITDVYLRNDYEVLRAFVAAMTGVDDVLVDEERAALQKWKLVFKVAEDQERDRKSTAAERERKEAEYKEKTRLNNDFYACWDEDGRLHNQSALPATLLVDLNKLNEEENVIFTLRGRMDDSRSHYNYLMWEQFHGSDHTLQTLLEQWVRRARKNLQQLLSLQTGVTPGEAEAIKAWHDFIVVSIPQVESKLRQLRGEPEVVVSEESKDDLRQAHGSLLGVLGKQADKLETGERVELTAEQNKLLGLLKRHERKLEVNAERGEQVINEEETEKLKGRLYLYLSQADAAGLGKTISALNKMGRGDLVSEEIARRRKLVNQYDGWKVNRQLAALRLLTTELTFEQMNEVDKWDEALRVAEEEAQHPKLPMSDERAVENKERETKMWEMVHKFRNSLQGIRGEDPGFARSWLHSLHESWVLNAKAEALHVLSDAVAFELQQVQELKNSGTKEEIGDWLVQRQHLLEVFKMIQDIATPDEKKVMDKYREESQASLELLEARLHPVKKLELVDAELKSIRPAKEAETEMTEEQKEETLMGQLELGSFGHVRALLEKWGWTKEKIISDKAFKFAAQKGIEKLWNEKPLARAVWVKFIKEFELETPSEPKPVRKSKKSV